MSTRRTFVWAALEGALWGVAVWIKPHCVLMAVGVWVVTARRVAGASRHRRAGLLADLLGNVFGGTVVGLAGIAQLVGSGTWPHFWEVLTVWALEYTALANSEFDKRMAEALHWFPPWSLWIVPTTILAVLSILDGTPWRARPTADGPGPVGRVLPKWLWDGEAGPDARFARAALATLYLVWAGQALIVQRQYHYVHMTELFLMFGLWAAHRWAMPAVVVLWLVLTSTAWIVGDMSPPVRDSLLRIARHDGRPSDAPDVEHYLVRYPLADPARLRLWPECWKTNPTDRELYSLWDRLQRIKNHEATISWVELGEVAEFLRSKGVKDYEVIAWHNSPHAVYQMLGIKPGVRYLHAITIQNISLNAYARLQAELAATAGVARFAVSDLELPAHGESPDRRKEILGPPADPPRDLLSYLLYARRELLSEGLSLPYRAVFPFNQPTVFRSRGGLGRYVVHELHPPLKDWPWTPE